MIIYGEIIFDDNDEKYKFINKGILKNVISSSYMEELNGENTLDFEMILSEDLKDIITMDTAFKIKSDYIDLDPNNDNSDWFIVGFFETRIGNDNLPILHIEADHFSYILNKKEYDIFPYNSEDGSGFQTMENQTASSILTTLLTDTNFISFSDSTELYTYEISNKMTRRQALIDFINITQLEVEYQRDKISLLIHRGSIVNKPAIIGKNMITVSKSIDKRIRINEDTENEQDFNITYNCEILELDDIYNIGDDIYLIDDSIGLNDKNQRVIKIEYNPIDETELKKITVGNISYRNLVTNLEDIISDSEIITDPNGLQGPEGPEGPMGPQGPKGDKGDSSFADGDFWSSANIWIGTSLPPISEAKEDTLYVIYS